MIKYQTIMKYSNLEFMLSLSQKSSNISLFLFDIDNILTNGNIIWSSNHVETKFFHVLDGFGIKLAQSLGYKVGVISARLSTVSEIRVKELGLNVFSIGGTDKLKSLENIKIDLKLESFQIAYMGDDLLDLPVIRNCGLSATSPNAVFEIKREVDYITEKSSGMGSVREWIDLVIKLSGKIK